MYSFVFSWQCLFIYLNTLTAATLMAHFTARTCNIKPILIQTTLPPQQNPLKVCHALIKASSSFNSDSSFAFMNSRDCGGFICHLVRGKKRLGSYRFNHPGWHFGVWWCLICWRRHVPLQTFTLSASLKVFLKKVRAVERMPWWSWGARCNATPPPSHFPLMWVLVPSLGTVKSGDAISLYLIRFLVSSSQSG